MSWVNVAVAGASLFNAYTSGQTAKSQGALQQQASEFQAGIEEKRGLETAEIIRRAGKKVQSAATAAYAGAGVKVGEGSALETEAQIGQDVEKDAYQAILEGSRRGRALRYEGSNASLSGQMQASAGYAQGVSSAIGSISTGVKGWKTGQAGQQPAAPIVDKSWGG